MGLGPVLLLLVIVVLFLANNRPPNIYIATHKLPKDNGNDYIIRAAAMLGTKGPSSSFRQPNSWTVAELRQYVISNTPALAMFREGLKREHVLPAIRSANADFAEYPRCRELARRLADEARYYREIGDYARAADSHLDCIEFGATFPRSGAMIAGIVGIAIEATGTHDFASLLPELNARELERVARRLERIEARRVPLADIVEEDGRSFAAWLTEMTGNRDFRLFISNPVNWFCESALGMGPPGSAGEVYGNARFAFRNKTAEVRSIMDYHKALAAEWRKPYAGKSSVPLPPNPLIQGVAPEIDSIRLDWEGNVAMLATMRAEVALRRYRLDHGRFPDRLSALAPVYLKKEPVDPLGQGKPLIYKPLDGGRTFLVYSQARNLK